MADCMAARELVRASIREVVGRGGGTVVMMFLSVKCSGYNRLVELYVTPNVDLCGRGCLCRL